jgi:putative lipase involved disintegration of autophagic bodies
LTDVKQIDNSLTSILGFVGYDKLKNDVVVAWRGTTDYKNWIADGDFKLTTYSGCSNCQIHQGFYLAYLSIAAKLQDAITALFNKYPTANLVITGHSLGGSIATITAL